MLINEKIRFMRQKKGWSQEEMAHQLNMSSNGYGNIERGYTNLSLSKLKKIAELFDENLRDMFLGISDNNTGTQNNQNFCSLFSDTGQCTLNIYVEFNSEKQKLIIVQQSNEIIMLRQINELLKEKVNRKCE